MQYFIAQNGQQHGPMNKEELVNFGLNPDSMIWHEGLPGWKKAAEIPEIMEMLNPAPAAQPVSEKVWYVHMSDQESGPYTAEEIGTMDVNAQTFVWKPGMSEWVPISQVPELMFFVIGQNSGLLDQTLTPADTTVSYSESNKAHDPEFEGIKKRSIAAIVLGFIFWYPFFTTCAGMGIAGVCLNNAAAKHYASGRERAAKTERLIAKILSIVGLVTALISIPFTVIMTFASLL